jgi:Reverse transcriptase (RNA-dependent DNA polymerase)
VNTEEFMDAPQNWHFFTKEKLSTESLISGLLNHGLFPDKIPPCFTSQGFAELASELLAEYIANEDGNKIKKYIEKYSSDYIRYQALRDTNVPRHLGVPHPASYAVQVFAIARHWQLILEHCNKPVSQFSQIHVRHTSNGRVFEMNYKGDEHYAKEETELTWMAGSKYVVKADIASCFPSMYTHTIPWALHGKTEAKKPDQAFKLAGNFIDKVTQGTRDKQTNGLLIGPHSSNVISEIILTTIDVDLQKKGYVKVLRYIDDYTFYAKNHDEAERFVKDLGMCLRAYELSLNDKKTQILELPRPSTENWIQRLSTFVFSDSEEIRISTIRSYLDLALECSKKIGKSTPLNYAIKSLGDRRLNCRAKRMYTQEAINLALAYPYLTPLLDEYVFHKYPYPEQVEVISKFCTTLVELGLQKLYPDAIAHAIYYAIKHQAKIDLPEQKLIEILSLDDCLTCVLLLEYAAYIKSETLENELKKYSDLLKSGDNRDVAKNWLLVYRLWSDDELNKKNQQFLVDLRNKGMKFIKFPEKPIPTAIN